MLTIYNSNKTEVLKELMLSLIDINPIEGVFSQEQILVQSSGMSKYLIQQIAERNGICANTAFPMVSSFMWELYHQTIEQAPKTSSYSKQTMRWHLVALIPEIINDEAYKKLKGYIGDSNNPLKIESNVHQLATQISDLFDGYQVYRPEMLLRWDADDVDLDAIKGQEWQPKLWKLLDSTIKEKTSGEPHRAELYAKFLTDIQNGKIDKSHVTHLPERIWIFGVPTMSPSQMKTIESLGTLIDINYMSINPSHLYWGDIKDRRYIHKQELKELHSSIATSNSLTPIDTESNELHLETSSGNPLLSSFGKLGRDHIAMISELEMKEEVSAFVEIPSDTLLGNVKNDIQLLRDPTDLTESEHSKHKTEINGKDSSIVINNCFAPIREVEHLQNHLLHLFDNDPTLKPRDVIVMCADIDKYSPLITSVFGNTPYFDERFIPYSISDRSAHTEHPIIASFCKIIDVTSTRYTATDVLTLLKNKAVLQKFGFEDSEYHDLYTLINEVGIRWGLDENTAVEFGLPSRNINTWSFGVTRLLWGFAMDSGSGDYEGYLPYDLPINVSSHTIGKLATFIDSLKEAHSMLMDEDNCLNWSNKLNKITSMFFEPTSNQETSAIDVIKRSSSRLVETTTAAKYDDKVSFRVISHELIQQLSSEQLSQRFLAGQLNFCTLMPMRSIPFKVVCLLGMNDGVYPKVLPQNKDDLIVLNPERGDRNRRESDRFLFLEALLSADEQLYISYTGRSIKDGQIRNKSILVQELLDYITASYCLVGDSTLDPDTSEAKLTKHLVQSRSMTPYSVDNFTEGASPFYFDDWLVTEEAVHRSAFCPEPLPEDEKELSEGNGVFRLNLSELMKFWKLPPRHFFSRRLKTDINITSIEIKDDEPFDLSLLDKYKLRSNWLDKLIVERDTGNKDSKQKLYDKVYSESNQNGVVPSGDIGKVCIKEEKLAIENLADDIIPLITSEPVHQNIDLLVETDNGDQVRIVGTIRDTFEKHAICYRGGSVRVYDLFDAWIRQLVLSASGISKHVFVLGVDSSHTITSLPPEYALTHLKQLIELYYVGLRAPLPYLPDVAEKGLNSTQYCELNDSNRNAALKAMKNAYKLNYEDNKSFGDRSTSRAFGEWSDELAERIHEWGLTVLDPCMGSTRSGLKHMEDL